MRSENRSRLKLRLLLLLVASMVTGISVALAQMQVETLSGTSFSEVAPAKPIPKWVVDDIRKMRVYPDQPPVIPHSIEGYQLSVNANRCLSCHRREFTESSGAPMVSVTHYLDRDGQMLADVSPRRYFCTACHVPQADALPLVGNSFRDMSEIGLKHAGEN